MTKRKAKSPAARGGRGKQARTSSSAASSSSSSSSPADDADLPSSFSESFAHLAGLHTLDLVEAARGSGSVMERAKATAVLLEEDGKREESLLDMSLRVDGDEDGSVCAFFHLLRLFGETGTFDNDSVDAKKLKTKAQALIKNAIKSMLPCLLRSFDPATTDAATGNNALHELTSRVVPASKGVWAYKLVEALILHGVDIHQRNKAGRTVALSLAEALRSHHKSACALHLLLEHGADLNAQDNEGDTLLHNLIHGGAVRVLRDLFGGDVNGLDLFVLNGAGQTPADLAAILHAEDPDDVECRQIHLTIRAQVEAWQSRVRPAVLRFLSEPLIADVAKLVLGYVDGSGLAFAAAEAPDTAAAD